MAKKSPKKEATNDYTITMRLDTQLLSGSGPTALDALMAIEKPFKIMSKGIVTVTKGNMRRQILMTPPQLKRLFYNKYYQAIQAKWLGQGLKPYVSA